MNKTLIEFTIKAEVSTNKIKNILAEDIEKDLDNLLGTLEYDVELKGLEVVYGNWKIHF